MLLPKAVHIYCDGACEPYNPNGAAAWGFVVFEPSTFSLLHQASGVAAVGNGATNNLAEFAAVVAAMRWLLQVGAENMSIKIKTDSQLVVKLLRKEWSANAGTGYYAAYKEAESLLAALRERNNKVKFVWIPREENTHADKLSKTAAFQAYSLHTDRSRLRFFSLKRATNCCICEKELEVGTDVVGIPLRGGVWKIFCKQHLNRSTEEVNHNGCEGVHAQESSEVR